MNARDQDGATPLNRTSESGLQAVLAQAGGHRTDPAEVIAIEPQVESSAQPVKPPPLQLPRSTLQTYEEFKSHVAPKDSVPTKVAPR